MTCSGFTKGILGGCSMAWLAPVIIFFLAAFARKYLSEEGGMPFSFVASLIGGMLSYILVVSLTCSFKIALVVGIIGMAVAGFIIGNMTGEGG